MTNHSPTIESRIANYRRCLDEAIENHAGTELPVGSTTSTLETNVAAFDPMLGEEARRLSWDRIGYLAAAVVAIAGTAAFYGSTFSAVRESQTNVAAETPWSVNTDAPRACPAAEDSELGPELPELDYTVPGFIVSLPRDTPAQTLAVRALLNPRAGENCLAYDPTTTRTTFDPATQTVNIRTQSTPANAELSINVVIGQSSESIGIATIQGQSEFEIIIDLTTQTLRFTGAVPADATTISLRFQKGTQNWTTDQTLPSSNSIPIEVPFNEIDSQPDEPFSSIIFTLSNAEGQTVDIGGIRLG